MATQSKTTNAGPVGLKPKGDYSSTATYTLLDCVKYNHDSWVCKAVNAQGEAIEITGQTPADGSQYWQALTDGGRAAYNEGETARQKGNQGNDAATKANLANTAATNANNKAALANEKAAYAQQQGDYAKTQAERAEAVAEQVVEEVLENFVFATPAECRAIVTNYR